MKYDLLVIGGGPGGYVAAIHASQLGKKTALAEKNQLGGTCLNRGCIPTKALMHSADLYREASSFSRLGINISDLSFDFQQMQERKDEVVTSLRDGVERLLKANKVDVFPGEAIVTAEGQAKIGDVVVEADNILLAAGSSPARPPIPGLELPDVLTSDELLSPEGKFYKKLIIIGGGVIGMEMASIYSALGSKVTVIEALEKILPTMDREISQNMSMIMKKRGVDIAVSARVSSIERSENGELICRYTQKEQEKTARGDAVLVAVGRRPEGLKAIDPCLIDKVETERGFFQVDEHFQTSVPGLYAVGDAIRGYQLAHAAEAQGIAAVEHMFGQSTPSVDPELVPACVYTSPEIATVGMSEEDAKKAGIQIKTGKYIMSANAKSIIEDQERSFIKLIFSAENEKIIGAQLMCSRATDMISELTMAVSAGLTRQQMLQAMRPHPTFSEGITEALEAVNGNSIHSMPGRRK